MQLYISSLAEEWQYKNPIEQFATLYGAGKCNQFYNVVTLSETAVTFAVPILHKAVVTCKIAVADRSVAQTGKIALSLAKLICIICLKLATELTIELLVE